MIDACDLQKAFGSVKAVDGVSFVARDGKHSLFVGKAAGEGNFVRRGGENTSYIAEPAISFETEPRYWIAARLFNIPVNTIQSVEIKPATGPAYSVHRVKADGAKAPVTDEFTLQGVPAGRKAASSESLAPSR